VSADDPGADGEKYVVGVDFGTLSGRALVVRVGDGTEVGTAVRDYPHGVMDRTFAPTGRPLPADWALQVPADYTEVLRAVVPEAIEAAGVDPADVIGIGTDFTASTPLPVRADGVPLCATPEFADRPHAYAKLWKHHAAQPYADRVNAVARERGEGWLARYGGKISAEWEYAKALQVLAEDPEVYAATELWVEAADWIIWTLTGSLVRNACTAGYKGIRQDGHYPSVDFHAALHADFADFAETRLAGMIGPLGAKAGALSARGAADTGLPAGIAVAVGNVDAHVAAAAAQATEPGQLVAIMGTSTCHILNADALYEAPGMCGVVDGGIVAGLWGYEAGQSGVGDIFAWFTDTSVPAGYRDKAVQRGQSIHDYLSELAAPQRPGEHGLLALDWHNGNRSVLVDADLSGVLIGATLATRPEDVYRALLEATAFGTRTIVSAFERAKIGVNEIIVAGGLTKNPLIMQIYADVTGLPLSVVGSEQASALGSAIHAAVAAGAYPDVRAASAAMGNVRRAAHKPDPANVAAYDALFEDYTTLHDYFGRGGNDVLHRLRRRREAVRQ
jgi:L-ribulokinase